MRAVNYLILSIVMTVAIIPFTRAADKAIANSELKDSPFTSKQSVIVVGNCGTENWNPGPITCVHGYYTRSAEVSTKPVKKNEPGVYFVYQSAARGPECTIPFTSGNKRVEIYFQQNFGSTEAGKITLGVKAGEKYVVHRQAYGGSYGDDIPGVGFFCLDSSK